MQKMKMVGAAALLAVVGLGMSALPGHAYAPKQDAISGLGYVDLAKVTDAIKQTSTWQTMTQKFDAKKNGFQQELEALNKTRYLTEAERGQLATLKAKAKATAGETADISRLEGRSDELDKEAQTLAAIEKPTAEQQTRIKELAEMRKTSLAKLQDEGDKRTEELKKLETDLLESMQNQVLKYVEQVAKSKNLTMVVDRQVILFGGDDLTQDVLKKLGTTK
jgi:Skp family chaperone for outer membrane proteins